MYLKKVEIKGFKSFANKVELEFEKGITAVIGPNGSGKSNIAEAIKWVLGEQSAKTLRGNKMEDVIFAGTEEKGALGYAEVILTIDNKDRLIDFSYSEIEVKRRLYRTGESEYSINGTKCRLKDILEIFMDTGIGKDGYSLIGQGKIEEILSKKSEDRRSIFEEAAGIVKYKWRKNETERRLDNTRQNLLRVDDIIDELKVQLEPLKAQSENAKEYLRYRDKLKGIEVNLLINNYLAIKESFEDFYSKSKAFKLDKIDYENKNVYLKQKDTHIKNRLKKIEKEILSTNKNIASLEKSHENEQGNLRLLNERLNNLIKEKSKLEEEIKSEKTLINEEETLIEELSKEINAKKTDLMNKKEVLSGVENDFETINRKYTTNEALIGNKKSDIIEIIKDLSDISNKESICETNIKNLLNRKEQILKERILKEDKLCILKNDEETINKTVSQLKKSIENIKVSIKEKNDRIAKQENENNKLTLERNSVFEKLKKREAKHTALSYMEKDMEGLSRAVKAIMRKYEKSEKVFGTISEILKVPSGFEVSIETALMASVQNIVVQNEDIAKEAISYLKENNLGRATFYPLTTIKERQINLNSDVKSIEGFKGVASDLVEYKEIFKNVIKSLLGRVLICDDLTSAREIAEKVNYSFKIVTLKGDVINPGGSYTGGSNNFKNSGLISRKNELTKLQNEIIILNENLLTIENELSFKNTVLEELKAQSIVIRERLQTEETKLSSEYLNRKSMEDNINSLKEDIKLILVEIEHTDNEIINNKKFNEIVLADKKVKIETQLKLEKEIESINLSFKEDNSIRNTLEEKLAKLKSEVNEIEKLIEVSEEKVISKNTLKASYEKRINVFIDRINSIEEKSLEAEKDIEKSELTIKSFLERIERVKFKGNKLQSLKGKILQEEDKNKKEINTIEEEIKELIETIHRFEVRISKLEGEKSMISSKLWENYEITIPEAIGLKQDIISIKEEETKVKSLKEVIKSLGNININAIEEYKAINERYEFLCNQKEDLLEAENSLLKIIKELTEKMAIQFNEKFKILKENFNETFKFLFGGGYANLKIEGDDPLSSSIDIIVQPPGKKLQSLSLLSGGEKGLSAIALVFAILKMKPTPFCVLDEIEAALDDVNVNRYAKFLKEYSKNTQFIIITHRKGSMAVAENLYGVTMEEKGISKIISLKLEREE